MGMYGFDGSKIGYSEGIRSDGGNIGQPVGPDKEITADVPTEDTAVKMEGEIVYSPLSEEQINAIPDDKPFFKTADVATILGISDQLVRNYCTAFEEFLDIEKTPSGHRRFKKEDIDKLGYYLQIMREKGFTVAETLKFLRGDDKKKEFHLADQDKKLDILLQIIEEDIKVAVEGMMEENREKLIEDSQTTKEAYDKLLDYVHKQDEDINELRDELRKRDEALKSLLDENKTDIIEALNSNKKKKFFFF